MLYLSLLLISVALWITIDLSYGRLLHLKRVSSRTFPLRQSDFHLYTYGKDLYDALFTDIKQAQHHIHFYATPLFVSPLSFLNLQKYIIF